MKTTNKKTIGKLTRRIIRLEKANEKLREQLYHSQVLNRAVFDHSPVGISVRNNAGDLLFVNRAWKRIWHLTNQQIKENERISRHWPLKKRYPYLKHKIKQFKRLFTKGGELFLPELKVENHKNGHPMWISQYFYAIVDKNKKMQQLVTLTQDITEYKTTELALRESDTRFRTIVENVNVGVYRTTVDPEGRFVQVNPALAKVFGFKSITEILKVKVRDLYENPKDRHAFLKELWRKKYVKNREILMHRKDHSLLWVSIYARAQCDDKGRIKWIDGVVEDITERKHKEEQLRALSLIDDLTGLYNRRGFMALAEHHLKIANQKKKSVMLIFTDLDNLKRINDDFGHSVGDHALIKTTNILKTTFRQSDIIARIGGDEFVVLTSDIKTTSAQDLYMRLQKRLDAFNQTGKHSYVLKLSVGWAYSSPKEPQNIRKLLSIADRSMYKHKQSKKRQ
jgi:diguanylate cyclase (GGDEF)-like protein/PAS domain S-box-containing protein